MHFSNLFKVGLAACSINTMALCAPAFAEPQKNVMFVLDASNSMWGQIDGKPKIEIAKSVLKELAGNMPIDVKMGLVSYGHRFDRKLNECDDMEQMNPIGHFSAVEADNSFSFITPKGQTPIAATLEATGEWMAEQNGQDNTLVLISDGLESCDGDPCAAASALKEAGITTKIHVVGFDLSESQRAKLQCISDNGNGKIFAANDATGMKKALESVQTDIEAPAPIIIAQAPKEPVNTIAFEDNFDGSFLADDWDVINPDINRYIVENGELLIIGALPAQTPVDEDMTNVFTHSQALPMGDWEIELQLKLDIQHGEEVLYFGAMNDAENWIAAGINTSFVSGSVSLMSFISKVEAGSKSGFDVAVETASDTGYAHTTQRWRKHGLGEKYAIEPFILTLRKSGRDYSYSGTYGAEGGDNFNTFHTDSLKMLRGKKKLFLAFGLGAHNSENQGEGSVMIDRVIIRVVK